RGAEDTGTRPAHRVLQSRRSGTDERTMNAAVRWDLVAEGLKSEWAHVGRWQMHARVSTLAVAPHAPVVVFVHGIGVSSRYMVPTALKLAETCRVYAPDLPGFGLSAKPSEFLDVPALADALAAWMRAVRL